MDSSLVTNYRTAVSNLIRLYRKVVFASRNFEKFPTDIELSSSLGISPVAFSSLSRGTASASGFTLSNLFFELRLLLTSKEFDAMLYDFLNTFKSC